MLIYVLPFALLALPTFFMGASMVLRSETKYNIYHMQDGIKRFFVMISVSYITLSLLIIISIVAKQQFIESVFWILLGLVVSAFFPPAISIYLIYLWRKIAE